MFTFLHGFLWWGHSIQVFQYLAWFLVWSVHSSLFLFSYINSWDFCYVYVSFVSPLSEICWRIFNGHEVSPKTNIFICEFLRSDSVWQASSTKLCILRSILVCKILWNFKMLMRFHSFHFSLIFLRSCLYSCSITILGIHECCVILEWKFSRFWYMHLWSFFFSAESFNLTSLLVVIQHELSSVIKGDLPIISWSLVSSEYVKIFQVIFIYLVLYNQLVFSSAIISFPIVCIYFLYLQLPSIHHYLFACCLYVSLTLTIAFT